MDDALRKAILDAVNEAGQSESVGKRLIAWFDELSKKQSLDEEQSKSFLNNLLDAIDSKTDQESD